VAPDRGPQAHRHVVSGHDHLLFLSGRNVRALIRLETAHPRRRSLPVGHLQQTVHHARREHGLLFPDTLGARGAGQLPDSDYDRAKDLALPKINLLSWYIFIAGALFSLTALIYGGVDTGWTFYTPLSSVILKTPVIVMGVGILIAGFASIFTG